MTKLTIFCFSDYHDQKEKLRTMRRRAAKADIIISAGDHTIFEHHQEEILKEFNSWKKPVIVIHGNHEEYQTLKATAKKYPHLIISHGGDHHLKNIRIITWGGGGFQLYDRKLAKQREKWKTTKHKDEPLILVTHAPPYNTTLDLHRKEHVGNKTIRSVIEQLQPAIALSGHIHECAGAKDVIGKTICYNLGTPGKLIDIKLSDKKKENKKNKEKKIHEVQKTKQDKQLKKKSQKEQAKNKM